MTNQPITLYKLCLLRISRILKEPRHENGDVAADENPFTLLPPAVVDDLIIYVVHVSTTSRPLVRSDLQLLMLTGRVTSLTLVETTCPERRVNVDEGNLAGILTDLSASTCLCLTTVIIAIARMRDDHAVGAALARLMSTAPNIQYVTSGIRFDLYSLHGCLHLKSLRINFPTENRLPYSPLVKVWVKENACHQEVAFMLSHYKELMSIVGPSISESLKYLHNSSDELKKTTYNIRECFMRALDRDTVEGVKIASLTCPHIERLIMKVNNHEAIRCLYRFRQLTQLHIHWFSETPGDFADGIKEVLEKSLDLEVLSLTNFNNVDLRLIGKHCLNLKRLFLKNCQLDARVQQLEPTISIKTESFRKLAVFYFKEVDANENENDIIGELLSKAVNLVNIDTNSAKWLTDAKLNGILKRNAFSLLRCLGIHGSSLTVDGWRNFVNTAKDLKTFWMRDGVSNHVARVVRESNPRICIVRIIYSSHTRR